MSAARIYFIIFKLLSVNIFIESNYFTAPELMETGKVKEKRLVNLKQINSLRHRLW